jgi:uncharacterized RDD family membrane protein YckC
MDVWIIRDGEKCGPFHDFEIRRKISDEELPPTTPAWHEGLDAWKPLVEIELFRREFERLPQADEPRFEPPDARRAPGAPESDPTDAPPTPPPLPVKPHYLRRFWARWFDLSLYSGVWWLAMWAAGQNIEAALRNPWVMFFQYVPWFVLEALLLQHHATTPGKWLLGLRVVNLDATRLDLAAATRRSMRVLFTGIGFGWGLLAIFCQAMSYFVAKRLGSPLWDHSGGHRVEAAPVPPLRVATFAMLFFGAIHLQLIVISPYLLEEAGKTFPAIKKAYEENPPWHLPERSSVRDHRTP